MKRPGTLQQWLYPKPGVKRCTSCRECFPFAQFTVNGTGDTKRTYLRSQCKKCRAKTVRGSRTRLREKSLCTRCQDPTDGRALCAKCRKLWRDYMVDRRLQNKKRAVALLGGMCVDCETRYEFLEVYDFHHLDPKTKDTDISNPDVKLIARSWERIEAELKKCVLLCSNCHRIRHARERLSRSQTPDAFVPEQEGAF